MIVGLVLENFTHPLAFEDFEVFTPGEFDNLLEEAGNNVLNEFA